MGVQRKGKDDVASDLSGMEGAVEAAQFHRMVAVEKRMKVAKIM